MRREDKREYNNTGQNHNLKTVAVTNQIHIHKEIKSRLNSENACDHFRVFSSPL
jgi:hypothetical protein